VLRDALRTGDAEELREVVDFVQLEINADRNLLDVRHGPGRAAAFEAAEDGHPEVLQLLLKVRWRCRDFVGVAGERA
jgi:hypothetical protein